MIIIKINSPLLLLYYKNIIYNTLLHYGFYLHIIYLFFSFLILIFFYIFYYINCILGIQYNYLTNYSVIVN